MGNNTRMSRRKDIEVSSELMVRGDGGRKWRE